MINSIKYARTLTGLIFSVLACYAYSDALPDYSDIVEEVLPSVVTITITTNEYNRVSDAALLENTDEIDDIFLPYVLAANAGNSGSGFVFSEEGYVLTNAHVVSNAESITVQLHDGRKFQAEIIGMDEGADVALLRIPADNLSPAGLAADDQILRVGQTVLGIGSPYSFEYSVTSGIISYLGRTLAKGGVQSQAASYIQTDMLINPGNSGGPIINGNGDVIGMSSRIFSTTGASIGISFGIPVNVIELMVDQFLAADELEQTSFGVETVNINPEQLRAYGLQQSVGALITYVTGNSVAEKSGLKVNDVIVTVGGNIVRSSEELQYQMSLLSAEQNIRITAIRNGRYFATEVAALTNAYQ